MSKTAAVQPTQNVPEVKPAGPLPPVDISKLSAADQKAVAKAWVTFGTKMVPMHEQWHGLNGSGGTKGPKSGELFVQFHANMMKDFMAELRRTSPKLAGRLNNQLPTWNTEKDPIPTALAYKGMATDSSIKWKVPDYLTAKGGTEAFTLKDDGGTKVIKSLNDISSVDELGRVFGTSGAHAVGHVRLGGTMAAFQSVSVAPFMLWHGKFEEIRQAWLQTDSGKAAAKAHPPEGWTDNKANSHQAMMAMKPGQWAGSGPKLMSESEVQKLWAAEAALQK